MSQVDLTVVVPAYDEEERLGPTLEEICAYLRGERSHGSAAAPGDGSHSAIAPGATAPGAAGGKGPWGEWELIVVDDGSRDRTPEIAAAAAAREPRVHVVSAGPNRGKGHALRQGVLASYGRRVLLTDADLAAPIEELEALDKALTDGHAAAIGSRAAPGAAIEHHQHPLRELLGRGGNHLIRRLAVPGIRDTQCGFKLFDGDVAREAFAASRLTGWGIDVEILQYLRRTGRLVVEVPVRWAHQEGSKVRALDYPRVLAELVLLKARTLRPAGRDTSTSDSTADSTSDSASEPASDSTSESASTVVPAPGPVLVPLLVPVLFLVLSTLLNQGRWTGGGPAHRYLPDSLQDQNQWEWFFAVTADHVAHFHDPLFTTLQNVPAGVNLMANTTMLGLSVPFAPVTWLFGPAISLALAMTLGLAATATAWYRLIVRRLAVRRSAAVLGAALAAFAPPMVSHANAHPNFVILFMVPLITDRLLRLCEDGPGHAVRHGAVLGLYTAYQIYLGEEPLLLAALGLLLFLVAYGAARPAAARMAWLPLARGLPIAVAVCLPLVAYPLYWQFLGPQSYAGVLHGDGAGNSPLALLSFAERSLAGDAATAARLSANPTEQNAFYGWPLAALAAAITLRLWARPAVRALACTAVAAAILSLGTRIRIPRTGIIVPGPWTLLAHRPVFESVIESRVAMICAPVLGMLVALAVDGLLARAVADGARRRAGTGTGAEADPALVTVPEAGVAETVVPEATVAPDGDVPGGSGEPGPRPVGRVLGILGLLAVAAALVPIVPAPLKAVDRVPVPAFIADGTWASYLDPRTGESLVPVPLPDPGNAEALHWQTTAHLGFRLPGGYFNGPYGPDRTGIYGAPPLPTSDLLRNVAYSGQVPQIGDAWRSQARTDLAYWRAGLVVLAPQPNDGPLRQVLQGLLGRPGRWVDGVWIWDLR